MEEQELWQEIYDLIASDWGKHNDDYPIIEQTVNDCMEIIKKYAVLKNEK